MKPKITRCPENPIIRPGLYDWRMAATMNPAVLHENGRFYLYERAAGGLRPFHCRIGALSSDDGVHFTHMSDRPVFTPEMAGSRYGSVQDPRTVKIGDAYYMTFAFRPFAWSSNPTGLGVPESKQTDFPGFSGRPEENQTRSGIAVSRDLLKWEFLGWVSPPDVDDRNVILFPEKIGGRYAVLRRPTTFVSTNTDHGREHPTICISYSDDMLTWTAPKTFVEPTLAWEDNRIGGSTPPIPTGFGWLMLYHGVQNTYPPTRRVCYRVGAMMLDRHNPEKIIARCPEQIMEPREYYEKVGLYIPNVIFPTGAVVVNGLLHIYYGVCDTAIAMATVPLDDLVSHVMESPV